MNGNHAAVPQASTLLYFFADQVVPKDSILTGGTPVPCKNQKVQTNQLANMMFAFAFWSLREHGAIALHIGKKKGLIFKSTPVQVTLLRQAVYSGLEGEIMRALGGVSAEQDVRAIVYRWFGSDSSWPHKLVINLAVQEAVALGYGAAGTGGVGAAVKGMFSGKVNFEPQCERITALAGEFNQILSGWHSFQSNDGALHEALLTECKSGISARVERNTRDTD